MEDLFIQDTLVDVFKFMYFFKMLKCARKIDCALIKLGYDRLDLDDLIDFFSSLDLTLLFFTS